MEIYSQIDGIIANASKNGGTLQEHEIYQILDLLGVKTPTFHFFNSENDITEEHLAKFQSERIVAKIVSPQIFHKTDIGGVVILEKDIKVLQYTWKKFRDICKDQKADFAGLLVCGFVDYKANVLGHEILYGTRWTDDFGHVLTFGIGGTETEFLAKMLKDDCNIHNDLVATLKREELQKSFENTLIYKKLSGNTRGGKRVLSDDSFFNSLWKLIEFSKHYSPWGKGKYLLKELEINPLVVSGDNLVALDGIMRFGEIPQIRRKPNLEKINKLLKPKTIGIVGVSGKSMNMGRIILNNIISGGFPLENVFVIKDGFEEIDGCKCFPNVEKLPRRVDLFVDAVNAAQTPKIISDLITHELCHSIIIIPGGMGETETGADIEAEIKELIAKADDPPVMVGGNCLGIQSFPGKYDTFFIPQFKLPKGRRLPGNLTFVSQSGAFVITKMSKLGVNFHYAISTGNQIDLGTSDYLGYFLEDPDIKLLTFYVEGFGYLDGLEFAKYAKEAIKKGKQVIFYKAGKTSAGQNAAMGHTASIAGEYQLSKKILKNAGVYWIDSFSDFEDSLKLFSSFHDKKVTGKRIGLISNAGFETVGMADNSTIENSPLEVPKLKEETIEKLKEVYKKGRLDEIANINNPLDITPVANDKVYESCTKIMLESDYIDSVIVSVVPLSPAINTLASSHEHKEDITHEKSLPNRLIALAKNTEKPLLVVIDSGEIYDPMATMLENENIPVFRNADRAAVAMARYLNYRI